MKKSISIILLLCLIISISGCSGKSNNEEPIDAASVSQKITPSLYAWTAPETESSQGAYGRPYAHNEYVYYLSNKENTYFICKINAENLGLETIAEYTDVVPKDITVSENENIYVLANAASDENMFFIIELNSSGDELNRYIIDFLDIETAGSPKEIAFTNENMFLLCGRSLIKIILDSDLSPDSEIDASPDARLISFNDNVALACMNEGLYNISILSGSSLKEEKSIKFNMPFTHITTGNVWDFYLGDKNGVYGYKLSDNTFKKLFTWNGIGLLSGNYTEAGEKLVCLGRTEENKPSLPIILSPIDPAQIDSSVIRFATTNPMGLDFRVETAIREWNIQNPNCPIEVIDYSVYLSGSDNRQAALKLTTDIISGDMPDIYDFSLSSIDTIVSSAQFARRGLLEDLYPYIDNDPELSRSDFIQGITSAMEINGGLYEFVPQYSVISTYANSQIIGPEENRTYAGYNAVVDSSEHFDSIFGDSLDRYFWLGNVLNASGKKLIDWDSGTCYFESEYFRNVLETAAQIPEEAAEPKYNLLNDMIKYNNGVLYFIILNDLWFASAGPEAWDEDYCFPGLPEVGNVLYPTCCYGISAYSANKDKCWEFLRQFLTDDYNLEFFISPRIDGLDAQITRSWNSIGELGQQHHTHGIEAMQNLVSEINDIDTVYRHDPKIWQIVYSEVGAYYAGQKSVEETMHQIQSRVSIYMAEQG